MRCSSCTYDKQPFLPALLTLHASPRSGQPARQMAFDRLDSNGDGYLSLDELMVQLPANDGSSDAGGLLTGCVDEAVELAGALGLPTSCLARRRLHPVCAVYLSQSSNPLSCRRAHAGGAAHAA